MADTLGPYVQVAYLLRVQKARGPHRELRRRGEQLAPRRWKYTDDPDTDPTLVTFEADDVVDIDGLLSQGAIRVYTPPKPAKKQKQEANDA